MDGDPKITCKQSHVVVDLKTERHFAIKRLASIVSVCFHRLFARYVVVTLAGYFLFYIVFPSAGEEHNDANDKRDCL